MRNLVHKVFVLAVSTALVGGCQQRDDDQSSQANAGSTAQTNGAAASGTPDTTIAQAVGGTQDLSTFAGAIKASGLEGTMAGAQPYTVFAPSNAAFQKLEAGTSENLMKPESKGQLTGILTYHIVPGVVTAKDLQTAIEKGDGKAELATVGGVNLTATQTDGAIIVSDAKGSQARVTQADMLQSNGVVHVVDTVLMPN